MLQDCSEVCPGMRRAISCILLLSGLCSCLYPYRLIDERKTWLEARQYCRKNYADLPTMESETDMQRLIAAAGSGYEGKVWIGLHDNPSSWKWTLSKRIDYGHGEQSFRKWEPSQPDQNVQRGKLCVAFHNGVWSDDSCNKDFYFICYNDTQPDLARTSKERYFLIKHKKNWDEAHSYCNQHHTGLASVRNQIENEMIQEVSERHEVWIGLHRYVWWWWSDGTRTDFQNWADNHPSNLSETCAASVMTAPHRGKWVETHCGEKLHFMCQNNKTQLFKMKLTALKSTIDLNHPAVLEAILNLMKQKMEEKGITRDFKISWIKKPGEKVFQREQEYEDVP